ncbi:MAG TPA: XdhC family protein, partial [Dehalococcoidia bacterium]|nr:XdhC family protein [Dehalococcoidia bacterium]
LPPPDLIIIGATHIAISLARIAREVGFRVTVIDARSVLATEDRFPDVYRLIRGWPDETMPGLFLGSQSSVVVLTHDPKFDIPALACALRSPAGYIGALGSRVTHQQRKARLLEQGFSEADLGRIRSPIGLDIGARTPGELAVSVLAEVVAVRYGRT